ncbi:protein EARLY FLOWERING 4-like isoform X1 [Ipomoea triloba]|uniref:protein EARLY FLOWERING 4-like isoform X1 n=2 Tax=Ipomoea triloba TaxID=35885 RepID=UPI00125DAA4F|nr:protein EARLY FLOWERING 4-like isoform X1 [Ipomoea triloba]
MCMTGVDWSMEDITSKAIQEHVGEKDGKEEECDADAWEMLSKCFREVQTALDQNRALIQQVNENQQSKLPDNLAKNAALIREINRNVSRVVGLYSDLSVNFAGLVHHRRALSAAATATAMVNRTKNTTNDQVKSADSDWSKFRLVY